MAMSRSDNMRAIRSKDMLPELTVRRLVHRLGYRYRLHRKDLPGKPDLVFSSRRKVIFVHGCFWHGHTCKEGRIPKSNADYWLPKLQRNQARDKENIGRLTAAGWEVLVIWECEMRYSGDIRIRVRNFLDGKAK
jgi:DNA mismatch endonuclease, patch repair protein